MPTVNIATHLKEMARRRPEQLAVLFPAACDSVGRTAYTSYTFQRLDQDSDWLAEGLKKIGIGRGIRTVLMIPPSLEFFAMTFALFKVGAVPVLIDPGMGLKNLGRCLDEAEPKAFVGVPKAQLARRLFGWGKTTVNNVLTVGRNSLFNRLLAGRTAWWDGRAVLFYEDDPTDEPFRAAETTDEETAAILFTSGSTGIPKGVVYTHGTFATQVELLKTTFGIEPGEVDLCTFPLFALFAPALGMTSIVPRMDFMRPALVDSSEILGPVEEFNVTNLFGSPALLNRVGRHCDLTDLFHSLPDCYTANEIEGALQRSLQQMQLKSFRRVLSAGAPVSPAIIERFSKLLAPGVKIFTPYGATEALPVAVIGSDEILAETRHKTAQGAGTCVGRPVEGVQVSIIRISDVAIAEWTDSLLLPLGEIGEIVVNGPNVTQEYFQRPDLTALAKILDPATGRMRHRMGDLGYFDDQGRLWFCGRKSHRVVTPERTLFTEPVEGIFNAHPQVFRTALVGVMRGGVMQPVLCIELEAEARQVSKAKLTEELLALGAKHDTSRPIQTILYHDAFPVDIRHNSKIFREKLAVWAAKRVK